MSMEKTEPAATRSPSRWPIYALLAAAVIVPSLFWKQVWFGSRLSDDEITLRLTRPTRPRAVQHACEQISRRMQRDPKSARQFYGPLVSLAEHQDPHIRYVVAWCMGEDDTRHPSFHQALLRLVKDEAPHVRYNAALALVRFGDPSGRPVLRDMLLPCTVPARWEGTADQGTIVDILKRDDPVKPLMQLVLVDTGEGEPEPLLAPLGGRIGEMKVSPGERIRKGDPVCTIEPNAQQAWEALRALAFVGRPEDLEPVEQYLEPPGRFSPSEQAPIQSQARLAAAAIRKREEQEKPAKR